MRMCVNQGKGFSLWAMVRHAVITGQFLIADSQSNETPQVCSLSQTPAIKLNPVIRQIQQRRDTTRRSK